METFNLPELYKKLLEFHEKLVAEQGELKATCVTDVKQFLDFIEISAQEGVKK